MTVRYPCFEYVPIICGTFTQYFANTLQTDKDDGDDEEVQPPPNLPSLLEGATECPIKDCGYKHEKPRMLKKHYMRWHVGESKHK